MLERRCIIHLKCLCGFICLNLSYLVCCELAGGVVLLHWNGTPAACSFRGIDEFKVTHLAPQFMRRSRYHHTLKPSLSRSPFSNRQATMCSVRKLILLLAVALAVSASTIASDVEPSLCKGKKGFCVVRRSSSTARM